MITKILNYIKPIWWNTEKDYKKLSSDRFFLELEMVRKSYLNGGFVVEIIGSKTNKDLLEEAIDREDYIEAIRLRDIMRNDL